MKNNFVYILLIAIFIGAFICFGMVGVKFSSKTDSYSKSTAGENSLVSFLKKNQISSVTTWDLIDEDTIIGEGTVAYCITQSQNEKASDDTSRVKVSIINENGSQIYVDEFYSVEKIYTSRITRENPPQLVIEAGFWRSGIVKILDYQKGKVVVLFDSSKSSGNSVLNAEIRPQFQTGIKTGSEQYQILLNTGVGLPSPEEKFTEVFRYKNGAFVNVGNFSITKMDNYIEKLLSENKSQ